MFFSPLDDLKELAYGDSFLDAGIDREPMLMGSITLPGNTIRLFKFDLRMMFDKESLLSGVKESSKAITKKVSQVKKQLYKLAPVPKLPSQKPLMKTAIRGSSND